MTMTNAEWIIQNGYKFEDIRLTPLNDRVAVIDVNGKKDPLIIQTQGVLYSFMKWLDEEHNESILDDAERRYLKDVIRPFRNKVEAIRKVKNLFVLIIDLESKSVCLPDFPAGTMYKGMEINHAYTLEELGL